MMDNRNLGPLALKSDARPVYVIQVTCIGFGWRPGVRYRVLGARSHHGGHRRSHPNSGGKNPHNGVKKGTDTSPRKEACSG
jgi:hypothetical protein